MKKILGVVVAVLMITTVYVGCQSDKAKNLAGVQQNEEAGIPRWIGRDFDYEDAEYYTGGYKPASVGILSSGKAKRTDARTSEIAAKLDAQANLASRIATEIGRAAADNGINAEAVTVSKVSAVLTGPRVVDTYTGADGTVYVLMFISDKDLKKSSAGGSLEEFVDLLAAEHAKKLGDQLKN